MTRSWGTAAGLAALLLLSGCAKPPDGAPAPVAPATSPDAAAPATTDPDLELVEPRLLLGRTAPGGYVTGVLEIRSTRDRTVVTQVEPLCGCTGADIAVPVALAAGEILRVPVSLDLTRVLRLGAGPPGVPQVVEREIAIASERGTKLSARLAVEVSERVRVEPAQVRLGSLPPGTPGTSEILVSAAPAAPVPRLADLVTGRPDLVARMQPAEDGATRIALTWTPASPEDLELLLPLEVEAPVPERLLVRVQGRAEPLVAVDPDRIENVSAATTQPVVATLTLRRVDRQPLEILSAGCTSHRIRVDVVPAQDSPVRTVRVVVPVLPLPSEISATVTLRTDARGSELVEVPVRVRAAR